MAGHSKWSKVKHFEGPLDQKRGLLFSRKRTAADLPLILNTSHGNLALPGAVSYMFHRKGRVTVPATTNQEERLFDLVIEAGGEELAQEDEDYVITTAPDKPYAVAEALKIAGVQADSQMLTFVAETQVTVTDPTVAAQVVRLIEALEDSDDVPHVHINFWPTEEAVAQLSH